MSRGSALSTHRGRGNRVRPSARPLIVTTRLRSFSRCLWMSSDTTRGQSSWFRPLDSTHTNTYGPVKSSSLLLQMWSRKSRMIFWFSSAPIKRFHLSVFTRSTQKACSRRKSTLSSDNTTPALRDGSWAARTPPAPPLLLLVPVASAMKTQLAEKTTLRAIGWKNDPHLDGSVNLTLLQSSMGCLHYPAWLRLCMEPEACNPTLKSEPSRKTRLESGYHGVGVRTRPNRMTG
ncbi:hypothetical protein EYF80_011688 [Liparis tanakae]|uniref:Uncharacterized protein n=1 Tax=Liparis tanakae TaxID=230148 RepID=A0A4Z2ILZ9_9TELE|nr:hypothetical protein EYF80_011688 [Liparis tanakae]